MDDYGLQKCDSAFCNLYKLWNGPGAACGWGETLDSLSTRWINSSGIRQPRIGLNREIIQYVVPGSSAEPEPCWGRGYEIEVRRR